MFVLIGVAYLRCRQYLRNSTAALTIRYLDKVADLAKLTRKKQLKLIVKISKNLKKYKFWIFPDFRFFKSPKT